MRVVTSTCHKFIEVICLFLLCIGSISCHCSLPTHAQCLLLHRHQPSSSTQKVAEKVACQALPCQYAAVGSMQPFSIVSGSVQAQSLLLTRWHRLLPEEAAMAAKTVDCSSCLSFPGAVNCQGMLCKCPYLNCRPGWE